MTQPVPTALVPPEVDSEVRAGGDLGDGPAGRVGTTIPVVPSRTTADEFRELFGASAAAVLHAMNVAEDDVVDQRPEPGGRLQAVGVSRRTVPVTIRNPFDASTLAMAICTVTVSCGVPGSKRGLHLSRLGDAIARSVGVAHDDLPAYAQGLARAVAAEENGDAMVEVEGSVPYVEQLDSESGIRAKRSLEHLTLLAGARVTPHDVRHDAGIRVCHLVACPCVQQTLKHAIRARPDADAAAAAALRIAPLLTHSQRCLTTVLVRGVRWRFVPTDALAALDKVLVRTCNTLPRDRELSCVYRAHRSPQFIEDALRTAVRQIAGLFPAAAYSRIRGSSRSIESIHEYDLRARMTFRPTAPEPGHDSRG